MENNQPSRELKHRGKTGTQDVYGRTYLGSCRYQICGGEMKRVRTGFGITEVTRRNVRPKSERILHELVANRSEAMSVCTKIDLSGNPGKAVVGG